MTWLRVRFKLGYNDYRPAIWPVIGPYWCTGTDSDGRWVLVAYVHNLDQIIDQWPEAIYLDSEEVQGIVFNSRFPKPVWWRDEVNTISNRHPKGETP